MFILTDLGVRVGLGHRETLVTAPSLLHPPPWLCPQGGPGTHAWRRDRYLLQDPETPCLCPSTYFSQKTTLVHNYTMSEQGLVIVKIVFEAWQQILMPITLGSLW